jgi:hypothetical protein
LGADPGKEKVVTVADAGTDVEDEETSGTKKRGRKAKA